MEIARSALTQCFSEFSKTVACFILVVSLCQKVDFAIHNVGRIVDVADDALLAVCSAQPDYSFHCCLSGDRLHFQVRVAALANFRSVLVRVTDAVYAKRAYE